MIRNEKKKRKNIFLVVSRHGYTCIFFLTRILLVRATNRLWAEPIDMSKTIKMSKFIFLQAEKSKLLVVPPAKKKFFNEVFGWVFYFQTTPMSSALRQNICVKNRSKIKLDKFFLMFPSGILIWVKATRGQATFFLLFIAIAVFFENALIELSCVRQNWELWVFLKMLF